MKMVPIKEAKNRIAELTREVEAGAHILITRNGVPVAEWTPVKRKGGIDWEAARRWKEERGVDRIVAHISDDFDDPLPEDFLVTPGPA